MVEILKQDQRIETMKEETWKKHVILFKKITNLYRNGKSCIVLKILVGTRSSFI